MLLTMHISNVALIDDIEVNFEEGLNILSGETGAGKSIIIGSIALCFGGKISKDLLRNPDRFGLIELVFSVDENKNSILKNILDEFDIPLEDHKLIISRKFSATKNTTRVNGEIITQANLHTITSCLLDLHGQHEHQSLLKKQKHLQFLDDYASKAVADLKDSIETEYRAYKEVCLELSSMDMDEELRQRELSFCNFELGEIDEANLVEGEEESLLYEFKKASHAKQIEDGLSEIYDDLESSKISASYLVSHALKSMNQIVSYDEDLSGLQNSLYDLESILNDVCKDVSSKLSKVDVDDEKLYELQKRLDLIHDLKRKYGNTVDDILAYRDKTKKKIDELTHYEERKNMLQSKKDEIFKKLDLLCKKLSEKRKEAAVVFEKELVAILKDLNFLTVDFEVHFETLQAPTANGIDDVCFYISTNPGNPKRPLQQVASGGELSRIMLALKAIMAKTDDVDTLVFDEIDTGISGRTAQKVAEMLSDIGKCRQVICISHLPQIVSMADHHYLIEKTADDTNTQTNIFPLSFDESVKEIARLLGGRELNDLVLENAKQMKLLSKA